MDRSADQFSAGVRQPGGTEKGERRQDTTEDCSATRAHSTSETFLNF